ncbi:hypothetical protein WKV44_08970 [Spirochaetia bacterium 38H-sp]|uniref:Tetratricopeptide repeat protein n=1 Tax=Rarispira pelagica TaxID=3141764 RepID=A0ABU9UDD1_9SPIR
MKKVIIFLFFVLLFFTACNNSTVDNDFDNFILLEPKIEREEILSNSDRIEELKSKIKKHKEAIDRTVQATGDLGIVYKLLAIEYMQREMYGPAKEALENAINIFPENPVLFQMAGVCSARLAKSKMDPAERERLFSLSISYYKRALELDPRLKDALYGISVVYIFEKNEPSSAIDYLTKLVSIDPSFIEARFLLARAYYMMRNMDASVDQYMYIIKNSKNKDEVEKAKENLNIITNNK